MTDLIQRLAEGPGSRELSDEVLVALRKIGEPAKTWLWQDDDPERPSPTESVDDALALVPEGWRIELAQPKGPKYRWSCTIDDLPKLVAGAIKKPEVHTVFAQTAACAICIAVLCTK